MSAPDKLRGGESELTRFKKLWRDSLAESAREFWRALFLSDTRQSEIRRQILAKFKINLVRDGQLTDFRSWLEDQDKRNKQAERMQENERRVTEQHPEWTLDQVRDEVLRASYFETMATGDFATGLKTVNAHLNVKRTDLESRRIVLLEKKAAAFDRAQAALTEGKKTKGGITPETLAKIERELNLL